MPVHWLDPSGLQSTHCPDDDGQLRAGSNRDTSDAIAIRDGLRKMIPKNPFSVFTPKGAIDTLIKIRAGIRDWSGPDWSWRSRRIS